MMTCNGYRMFCGTATVTPSNPTIDVFTMTGTWLYNPTTRCWYCEPADGFCVSYPEALISNMKEV